MNTHESSSTEILNDFHEFSMKTLHEFIPLFESRNIPENRTKFMNNHPSRFGSCRPVSFRVFNFEPSRLANTKMSTLMIKENAKNYDSHNSEF